MALVRSRVLAALAVALLAGCGSDPIEADDIPISHDAFVGRTIDTGTGPVERVSADAGAVVWTKLTRAGFNLHTRTGTKARVLAGVPRPAGDGDPPSSFDVGAGKDGRPVVAWSVGCTGQRPCLVRAVPVAGGKARVIARLRGRPTAPVAIDGDLLVHVARVAGCDEIYVHTLPRGPNHRLGRGTCGEVRHLDIQSGKVAAAVATSPPQGEDNFPSEAWLMDTSGGGLQVVQREDAGYGGPDAIEGVALDEGALFTIRLGDQRRQVVRIPFGDGKPSSTRLRESPTSVARDRGTTYAITGPESTKPSRLVAYRNR